METGIAILSPLAPLGSVSKGFHISAISISIASNVNHVPIHRNKATENVSVVDILLVTQALNIKYG